MRSSFKRLSKPEVEKITELTNFTDEELNIFKMLCKGRSLEEISFKMSMSKSTVSRRVKEIKIKVGGERLIKTIPTWEKVTMTIDEAAEYSNIGINKISAMLNEPGCTFVLYVGKGKRLVKRREFEKKKKKSREI